MRRPSPLVLGFVASLSASIAALSPLVPSARGDLDRIAADGVTEKGGSAEYARMLPRTGADGRLDASLLPPVADWASQPISNLYYAAGNSPVQGNGSPQYPFRTLTYALSHMLPGSALLLAPATYSGTLALQSGQTVTLVGLGPSSYVSSLSVTASGSSSGTRLALVGLRVGTLSLAGGTVDVRLSHSTVAQLTGSASTATVTRMDLGSLVGISTLTHTEVYAGYDTVPYANAVRTPDGTASLALSEGRAIVDSDGTEHTVAYLSDVASSTNGVYTILRALQAADTALSALVSAESSVRLAADTALSNRLDAVKTALEAQVVGVGTAWGGRLSTVVAAIENFQYELEVLRTNTTAAIQALAGDIADVDAAYQAGDAALSGMISAVSADLDALDNGLDRRIEVGATSVARSVVNDEAGAIVSNAVTVANANAATIRTELIGRINTAKTDLRSELIDRILAYESRLAAAERTINELISSLAAARDNYGNSFTTFFNVTLPSQLH